MESYGPYINEQLMGKALKGCTDRVFVTSKFGHKYIKEWQSRPIESMYTIVWLDPMHYKVKEDGRIESLIGYNVLAVNKDGHKEQIGMYVSESEGSNFWLSVLTDLQVRKVTKTKGVFPNDMALMKLIYLAAMNISKKWTQPLQNWALTAGQLRIKFSERMPITI